MAEFDYIIIGAGSAGCVLADKLTEDGRNRVLVLESGGSDAKFWIKVPLGYAYTYNNPKLTVECATQPDAGLSGRSALWPRGRVVGGCSSVNAMAYMRGLDHDYEDWVTAGAAGWDWQTVRDVFSMLEAGPLKVSDLSRHMHPFSGQFIDAAHQIGWPVSDDLNSGTAGLGRYRSTVWKGRRWSAADAFLRPAIKRGQVKIETHAHVQGIDIIDGAAQGVTYKKGGQTLHATARHEVILSAGAVHSPQVLQLSGIGDGDLLRSHGLNVINPLSQVGQGLQDHLGITYSFAAHPKTLNSILGRFMGRMFSGVRYLMTKGGPLAVPVNQVGGYIPSGASRAPDTQIYCNPMAYTYGPKGPTVTAKPGFILSAQPCRPTSRGEIRIASASPEDEPIIQPNSLSTDADQQGAIRAGRLLQALAQSETLSQARSGAIGPDLTAMTDADLLQDFRDRASTVFHPSCTCQMGDDPATSVLDERLRVHGTRRLRVVDASAFPNITSGNTNAPTMMLAARAAQLILEDNR